MIDILYTDTSKITIPTGINCGVDSSTEIFTNISGSTTTYSLIGNTWYPTNTVPVTASQTLQDCSFIPVIESPWGYNIVYYQLCAAVTVTAIFFALFWVLIRPWYRRPK